MIRLVHEAGCGIRFIKIHFMKKKIQLIIIMDALIIKLRIIAEKLVFSFITTTSTNY